MAWLHARPKQGKDQGDSRKSRMQLRRERGLEPKLPPVECMPHVTDWFLDVGPGLAGVSGMVPVSNSELRDWVELNNVAITDFEVSALRKMSEQYCAQSYISDDPYCEPPYEMPVSDTEMAAVRKAADDKLRGMWK